MSEVTWSLFLFPTQTHPRPSSMQPLFTLLQLTSYPQRAVCSVWILQQHQLAPCELLVFVFFVFLAQCIRVGDKTSAWFTFLHIFGASVREIRHHIARRQLIHELGTFVSGNLQLYSNSFGLVGLRVRFVFCAACTSEKSVASAKIAPLPRYFS